MIFRVNLSPTEWDALIALGKQAARYPADELRQVLRVELAEAGLLKPVAEYPDPKVDPVPECQESLCDHR